MINKLDMLWVPNLIALGIYFIFRPKLSWNEGIDTCFNIEYLLLSRNFNFLGGYLVVTAGYCWLLPVNCWLLVVTSRYCWSLLVTARYCSFPLLVWTRIFWHFFWILWILKPQWVPTLKVHLRRFENSEEAV